jgi:hypothetical protein
MSTDVSFPFWTICYFWPLGIRCLRLLSVQHLIYALAWHRTVGNTAQEGLRANGTGWNVYVLLSLRYGVNFATTQELNSLGRTGLVA